jgi:tetratricopeptide (TPR) repeat protein
MNRGITYLMLKDFEKAKADLEKGILLNPQSTTAYFNLGYLHRCLGFYDLLKVIMKKQRMLLTM